MKNVSFNKLKVHLHIVGPWFTGFTWTSGKLDPGVHYALCMDDGVSASVQKDLKANIRDVYRRKLYNHEIPIGVQLSQSISLPCRNLGELAVANLAFRGINYISGDLTLQGYKFIDLDGAVGHIMIEPGRKRVNPEFLMLLDDCEGMDALEFNYTDRIKHSPNEHLAARIDMMLPTVEGELRRLLLDCRQRIAMQPNLIAVK